MMNDEMHVLQQKLCDAVYKYGATHKKTLAISKRLDEIIVQEQRTISEKGGKVKMEQSDIITLGIDASLTGTGTSLIRSNGIAATNRIASKHTGIARLINIEDRLKYIVDTNKLNLVLIEGYAYAAQNQAHQIGELGGVIRRMLYKKQLPWVEVSPSQVKKFATGKGNAKKDLIIMNVFKKWGQEFETSDEADAFVLAKIGQVLLNGGEITQYQSEVIEEISKKYKEVLPQWQIQKS